MNPLCQRLLLALLVSGCSWNSVEDQAEKLGQKEFTVEGWSIATEAEKATMTASFLRKYKPASLNRRDIVRLLGEPTGYYHYDTNPAYYVGLNAAQNNDGDGYLWVFEADKDNGQIDRVFFLPEVR